MIRQSCLVTACLIAGTLQVHVQEASPLKTAVAPRQVESIQTQTVPDSRTTLVGGVTDYVIRKGDTLKKPAQPSPN